MCGGRIEYPPRPGPRAMTRELRVAAFPFPGADTKASSLIRVSNSTWQFQPGSPRRARRTSRARRSHSSGATPGWSGLRRVLRSPVAAFRRGAGSARDGRWPSDVALPSPSLAVALGVGPGSVRERETAFCAGTMNLVEERSGTEKVLQCGAQAAVGPPLTRGDHSDRAVEAGDSYPRGADVAVRGVQPVVRGVSKDRANSASVWKSFSRRPTRGLTWCRSPVPRWWVVTYV